MYIGLLGLLKLMQWVTEYDLSIDGHWTVTEWADTDIRNEMMAINDSKKHTHKNPGVDTNHVDETEC